MTARQAAEYAAQCADGQQSRHGPPDQDREAITFLGDEADLDHPECSPHTVVRHDDRDCRGRHVVIDGNRYDVLPHLAIDGIWRTAKLEYCPGEVQRRVEQRAAHCGWPDNHAPHGECAGALPDLSRSETQA